MSAGCVAETHYLCRDSVQCRTMVGLQFSQATNFVNPTPKKWFVEKNCPHCSVITPIYLSTYVRSYALREEIVM